MVRALRVRNLANYSSGQAFELDRDGRLFDPSAREAMTRMAGKNPLLALEALAALRLAANRVHTARERWTESHGLSESRLRILTALFYSPEHRRPLGELAEMLGVVPRTMTDVVDVLERDGLIRRAPDPKDRRSVHAQLTRAGLERIETLRRDAVAQEAALFSSFKRGQLAELRHLCLLLVQHLATTKGGS
jgi:DNA-binding MarR family transcriptional regulator